MNPPETFVDAAGFGSFRRANEVSYSRTVLYILYAVGGTLRADLGGGFFFHRASSLDVKRDSVLEIPGYHVAAEDKIGQDTFHHSDDHARPTYYFFHMPPGLALKVSMSKGNAK